MAIPISNVTRRTVYAPTGAGGAGPYAFTFEILANTDIAVFKDDTLLTLTTHYTVTINANGTGSVTITAAGLALTPTSPTQYAIVGNRTISRSTDFTTGGDFFANTLNDELDQQTIFAQQNAEGVTRALQAPQTDPTTIDMTLPRSSVRAGKVLSFDASGNPSATEFIGSNRGNWATGTIYYVRDIVKDTSTSNIWQCLTQHTSSGSQPISTNADSAKWFLLVDAAAAGASATAAASSASAASTSASNASTSATNAASSASTASTQASNASTSATNASNSATAASSSATTASTAATNAGNSATSASTSATNASNSATSASGSASTATTQASNASTSATAAAGSASTATTQATNAATSASGASTSASNAATSASNASTSATAAAASAASAAASFDAFDDIYLGAKASDPTVDNDGNALTTGDQYFNTASNELRVWNGSTWQAASTVGGTVTSVNVTGVASFADGSAAAPSITNDGDTNTGIYFPAADTIAFTEGGAEAMRIDSAGNLGLGVTPSAWATAYKVLQVASTSGAFLAGSTDTNALTLGYNTFNNSARDWKYINTAAASRYDQSAGAHYWYNAPSGTAGNTISFTQAMTLDASGNLGIGTSSPSVKLHVVGSGKFTGITEFTNAINLTTSTLNYVYFNDALAFSRNGTGERMRLDTSGNLGIGTTSISSRLDVRGANTLVSAQYGIANIYSTDAFAINKGGSLSFGGKYATDGSFQTFAAIAGRKEDAGDGGWAGYLQFVTGTTPTERMRITSTGDVGIGTASPSNALVVTRPLNTAVNLQIVQTGLEAWTVGMAANSSALAFSNSGTERARFNTTGALVFAGGTTTADGIGITFPATQSASSNANTLDDYEEGNGTPTVGLITSGSVTLAGGASYQYTKIGNLVTFTFEFEITAVSSPVGAIKVNLPFTSSVYSAGALRVYNNTFTGVPFIEVFTSGAYCSFKTNVSASSNGNITGQTGYYFGTVTYRV